ncbi:MAG: hypothetical protein WCT07_01980 [Candidatus Paceibacterota bacterium]|jgi:hypothetical protein
MLEKVHPTKVLGLEPNETLGKEIMALRYDLILPIIKGMAKEIKRQEAGDRSRERTKLANELEKLQETITSVTSHIENLVTICKPYIEQEKNTV